MASSSSNPNSDATKNPPLLPYDLSNTTYVQADLSNFRAVVQRLTGAAAAAASNLAIDSTSEVGFRKLRERRQSAARKLEIILGARNRGFEKAVVSPASTLDLFGQESPGSPAAADEEEEEKAIAEKGYYFHPITPRRSKPELLPLFPLHSPRDD